MGMTLVEKIFARKLGKSSISADECVFAPIDLNLGTEISAPLTIKVFREMVEEMETAAVFDPSTIVLINDHFVPAKDIASANQAKIVRNFALEQGIKKYFEIGRCGICHITLPEEGLVTPGDIIIGTDSHTVTYGPLGAFATGVGCTDMAAAWATGQLWFKIPQTIQVMLNGKPNQYVSGKDIILKVIQMLGPAGALYKVLEFAGQGIKELSMADRFTMCNMTIECGAKSGLMMVDKTAEEYLEGRLEKIGVALTPDADAEYFDVIHIDLSEIQPLVAAPYDPTNVHPVEAFSGVKIDQVVIGSCTNGRIEDFRIAHRILKGKIVNEQVRLIIIPGSPRVLKQMVTENLLADFIDAGAVIAPSTCGPCIGGHMGVLGDNEVGLFTTNRNFVGRNGAPTSKVYLCSPAVAAFSAIKGKIVAPG